MEAPTLLKSRNELFIQVRYKAAFRFMNVDPTGTPSPVYRVIYPPGTPVCSSVGWAGRGVAGRCPGPSRAPRSPLFTLPHFSSSLTLCLQDQTHVAPAHTLPERLSGWEGDHCYQ